MKDKKKDAMATDRYVGKPKQTTKHKEAVKSFEKTIKKNK